MTEVTKVEAETNEGFGDRQMDAIMGRLLQVGVLLASSVVLLGGALYLGEHHGTRPNYRNFVSEPATLRKPVQMFHGIGRGDAASIIQLGILLLIATPIARVAFAAIAFAVEKDKLYTVVSLVILGVLLFGFFTAK